MELKVIVPTSLSEITLDQYQRFVRLDGDEEFLSHKMLEIFCGVPLAKLPNVKFKSLAGVVNRLNGMFRFLGKIAEGTTAFSASNEIQT